MAHFVREWMSKPVIVIDPDSSVSHALTLMRRRRIHSLIVEMSVDGALSYGIITSTDIRDKIVASDANPAEITARDIMTSPVVTANPDWTLKECSLTMQEKGFHHLPVMDKAGLIVGMISDTDIFMAAEEIGWIGR